MKKLLITLFLMMLLASSAVAEVIKLRCYEKDWDITGFITIDTVAKTGCWGYTQCGKLQITDQSYYWTFLKSDPKDKTQGYYFVDRVTRKFSSGDVGFGRHYNYSNGVCQLATPKF